jgi:hypothetical protein
MAGPIEILKARGELAPAFEHEGYSAAVSQDWVKAFAEKS